ncbi:hypothetical protein [Salinarimonas chemoclinalis]|uniref:hypothetical protein n=1 Tax=Salinarimonas chemoclinalis TaxID=3241599 RepID=UPI0035564D23
MPDDDATRQYDEPVELPGHVEVFSDVILGADVVSRSGFALLAGIGMTETADPVLVPMLEWSLQVDAGGTGAESPPVVRVIPFENAAYLLKDMASDLAIVTAQLHALSAGGIRPVAQRIDATDRFLADVEQDIKASRAALARLLESDSSET